MPTTPQATAKNHNPQASRSGPRGSARNGVAREQLSDIQRARILSATVDVVAEEGAANATIAHIVGRSGVSRRTFYEIFTDRDDCFLVAFDDAVARASERVQEAHDPDANWATGIRSGLIALLSFLEDEPKIARLLIIESLAAGPKALHRRSQILGQIMAIVDEGREVGSGEGPPPLTAEATVGAVLSILHAHLSSKGTLRLMELANPLMSTITLPYLGMAASRRELTRPVPKPDRNNKSKPGGTTDPLRELEMRLTYRTVRVLSTIASNPGSSNRAVGEHSGITDQGQISKLLARLKKLGLIQTAGNGATYGEPNAWTLTSHGQSVVQMVS